MPEELKVATTAGMEPADHRSRVGAHEVSPWMTLSERLSGANHFGPVWTIMEGLSVFMNGGRFEVAIPW